MIMRVNTFQYRLVPVIAGVSVAFAAVPSLVQAQDIEAENSEVLPVPPKPKKFGGEDSVFDGTWGAVGAGLRYDADYDGSDDYKLYALPALAGEIGGIKFTPKAAGFALEVFEIDLTDNIELTGGPEARARFNRTSKVKDPVVAAAGKLDTAIEIGGSVGLTFKRVLHSYDRLSVGTDFRWDVASAHGGMVVSPSISYRTPFSRGTVATVTASAIWADTSFSDYYFSVSPEQSAASGLPVYSADKGWYKAGAKFAFGYDLDNNLNNGGFVVGVLGGYSRMLNEGAATPYTSLRGDADQFYVATGFGYVF